MAGTGLDGRVPNEGPRTVQELAENLSIIEQSRTQTVEALDTSSGKLALIENPEVGVSIARFHRALDDIDHMTERLGLIRVRASEVLGRFRAAPSGRSPPGTGTLRGGLTTAGGSSIRTGCAR